MTRAHPKMDTPRTFFFFTKEKSDGNPPGPAGRRVSALRDGAPEVPVALASRDGLGTHLGAFGLGDLEPEAHAFRQDFGEHGLRQVLVRARRERALLALETGVAGDGDDRDVPRPRI